MESPKNLGSAKQKTKRKPRVKLGFPERTTSKRNLSQASYKAESQQTPKKKTGAATKNLTYLALQGKRPVPVYGIPKEQLDEALEQLNAELESKIPRHEIDCHAFIHLYDAKKHLMKKDSYVRLFQECRKCVLRRDWRNLAGILTVCKPLVNKEFSYFYPIFVKYAIICLLHDPKAKKSNSLDSYLQAVLLKATSLQLKTDEDKAEYMKTLLSLL